MALVKVSEKWKSKILYMFVLKGKFGALKKRLNEHLKEIMEGDSEGSEEPDIYQGMYSYIPKYKY